MRPLVKYHRRDVGGDKKSPRAFSPAFSRECPWKCPRWFSWVGPLL